MKAGSPLSVRTLSFGFFFVIFGNAFVDLRWEFQIFVYVARIWIFWIQANGKLLLLLKLEHLLTAWRTIAFGYDLFYQRALLLFLTLNNCCKVFTIELAICRKRDANSAAFADRDLYEPVDLIEINTERSFGIHFAYSTTM